MKSIADLIALCVILVLIITGCTGEEEPSYETVWNLSHKELEERGFYAYVLPEAYVVEKDWKEEIRGAGNSHCGKDMSGWVYSTWIEYHDNQNQSLFSQLKIGIRPPSASGPPTEFSTWEGVPIQLESAWIPSHRGDYYYPKGGGIHIRFTDVLGMNVYVGTARTSTMKIDELTELISSLEYIRPDIDTIGNPWANVCK